MRLVTPLSISATVNSSLTLEFSKNICVYRSVASFDFLETFNLSSVILQQPAPSANPRALKAPQSMPKTSRAGKGKDRKSTRLNSSHANISYAVFCLKKKKKNKTQ